MSKIRKIRKNGGNPILLHKHSEDAVGTRDAPIQPSIEIQTSSGFTALMEKAMQETLAVTYWFNPVPHGGSYPVTVRFSGHRVAVKGQPLASDRFIQDETIEAVVFGSGPVSLTARVRGINPGEWVATAYVLGEPTSAQRPRKKKNRTPAAGPFGPITQLWHKWAPSVESTEHVNTCLIALARVPGIIPGIWAAMATLGIILALMIQTLVISADHLAVGPWWVVTLGAILVGIISAKGWYLYLYRHQHLKNGWCIQGFITGATLATVVLLVVFHMPGRIFLDTAAPGVLLAMAVGRVGCFFAGCCGGPATASRFGVWSSDQRVGARRIPTQLLESALALSLGIFVLITILVHGLEGGAFFMGGLALYTLVRQGILHLRAEPRRSRLGGPITATLATFVLVVAVVFHTWNL